MNDIADELAQLAKAALQVDYGVTKGAIADAKANLKRIIARSQDKQANSERWELKASRGPTYEFAGVLLCSDTFVSKGPDPLEIEISVFETKAGALIAYSSAVPAERDGYEIIDVAVVEPCDDVQAMRFQIMDFFRWELRARSMVTKQLKWSLRKDIA